jgi:phage antirepressor YoqD-like protein
MSCARTTEKAEAGAAGQASVILAQHSTAVTMSSRELAALVESRHDTVKLCIERLAARGVIALPPLAEVSNPGPGPRFVTEYRVGQRDSYVIVAQLSPEFTGRLVDRWQELEVRQAAAPTLPRNFAEALRLAADQAEQLEAQCLQIEQQRPAVEFVAYYVDGTGTLGVRQVAKLLKASEREFIAWLIDRSVMYRLGGRLTAAAPHLTAGRFEIKTGSADNGHAFTEARFTPKGVQWIAGEWGKHMAGLMPRTNGGRS